MVNTREYNKKRFSIFESEEKTALELMNELGQACNEVLDRADQVEILANENKNKKVSYDDLHTKYQLTTDGTNANFNGSWQGLNKPTLSQEGAFAQVEKNTDDIKDVKELSAQLDNRTNELENKKANISDVRLKSVPNTLNDCDENLLKAIQGGNNTSFNLLSIPRNESVTYGKLNSTLKDIYKEILENIDVTFTSGKYYNCENGNLSNGEDDNSYGELLVAPYEEYLISGRSSWLANIYILIDEDSNILEVFPNTNAAGTDYNNIRVTIPANGYKLLLNSNTANATKIKKSVNIKFNAEKISTLKDGIININNLDEKLSSIYKVKYIPLIVDFIDGGYYRYDNCKLTSDSNFQNAKIEVKKGENYKISGATSYFANLYIIVDKDNKILEVFPNTNESGSVYTDINVVIPENAKYMLINQRNNVINTTVRKANAYAVKNEIGLNWCAMGDSLTDFNTLGSDNYNYTNFVSNELGLKLTNCGKGGTGYLNDNNGYSKPFYARTSDIPKDTDVLTVFGSFNDLFISDFKIGNINDTGTDTLYGAIKKFISNCWVINPSMIVGIVSPTPWSGRWRGHSTNANACIEYVEVLENVAKYYSLPYLNLFDGSNLRPWDSWFNSTYYKDSDGIHPNSEGHKKFIYPKFKKFIETIIQDY